VQDMFTKLTDNNDTTLAFAVRRFNDADERIRDEDVVYCFSTLEALFAGGSTTEVTYRLSLHGASSYARRVRTALNCSSGSRTYAQSKIVHEGRVRSDRLATDAAGAISLLRAAITAWLDAGGYDGDQLDQPLSE
jgi:hypothetical protein